MRHTITPDEFREMYDKFSELFMDQLGLDLSEMIDREKLELKGEKLGLAMASRNLSLTKEEHGEMAEFICCLPPWGPGRFYVGSSPVCYEMNVSELRT